MGSGFEDARQAQYIGFLHRHPYTTDAYELGFAVGVREDYSYQTHDLTNVDLPVTILDNDFRNPDLDRYLERFEELDPSVAILGDAYDRKEAEELNQVATDLLEENPYKEIVVVPKCREAIDVVDEQLVLGYAMGYSNVQATEFSDISDWRGRRVHLLGASPTKQYRVIENLTQPTLTDDPPAEITGLDWNGIYPTALKGESWTKNGWQPAHHLTIRETVRASLREVKRFWTEKGVWPDTEPIDLYGSAVNVPNDLVYAVNGADIDSREQLEDSIVEAYRLEGTRVRLAFQTNTEKAFVEWRERMDPE